LVPVVYQQDPYDFSFAAAAVDTKAVKLPEEVQDQNNPYGLVGRDGAILKLERAMRQRPAGILIQGLGGVGKTTLARGFVQWMAATEGLGKGCFWFGFGEIRSAEFVINRLGDRQRGFSAQRLWQPKVDKREPCRPCREDAPRITQHLRRTTKKSMRSLFTACAGQRQHCYTRRAAIARANHIQPVFR
jgi:hypothetical protein